MGLVVRGGGYEAGARDERSNDPAVVAVLGAVGEDPRVRAGTYVGNHTWKQLPRRSV